MRRIRGPWGAGSIISAMALLVALGCYHTPVDTSEYARGPAPLRISSPARPGEACSCYEDSLTGGHIFEMYCGYCHNARSLAERPFSNYKNVAQHMHVRANLTGAEYAQLVAWLRRWHDVPAPTPPVELSPKRFFFSQPIPELRKEPETTGETPGAPQPGAPVSQTPAP